MRSIRDSKSFEEIGYHAKKKTTRYKEQDYDKVAAYKYEISDINPDNIAYVDESGIDRALFREYGYAARGELVLSRISGRRYARVGVVAARMGKEILAPYQFQGTMDHELFEDWFENHLLPALPEGSVVVMDNASFHRKQQLYCLASQSGHPLIFLPPYSPELNPIEHFWAWLKRTLRNILPRLDFFDCALFAAFYFRDRLNQI